MFGTNGLRKAMAKDDYESLYVQSIFSTIQGEGPFAGFAAIFVRLAYCNLRCHFCDTDFESRAQPMKPEAVAAEVIRLAAENKIRRTGLMVLTGGEPLLQERILDLITQLHEVGIFVQIETAGTVWPYGLERLIEAGMVHLVCSPKTGKVHPMVAQYCRDFKYLISEGCVDPDDGLPNMSTQIEGASLRIWRPQGEAAIWLQPCEAYKVDRKKISLSTIDQQFGLSDQMITSSVRDEAQTQRNIALAAELAMRYNYRISVQVHKLLRLP